MHFTAIDIIILALFVPAIWIGLSKGFVRQIAGLLALILGIWGAWHFSDLAAGWLKPYVSAEHSVLQVTSFIVVFLVILFAVWLIGRAAEGIVKITMLSWVDKLLGLFFAILKTAFILSLIIYLLNSVNHIAEFLPKDIFAGSPVYTFISHLAPAIFPYLKNL